MRRIGEDARRTARGAREAGSGRLRIAGDVDDARRGSSRADHAPARPARPQADRSANRAWEVAAENRAAASSISAFDARWVLAVRAADALEGGRAAVLRPETRQRLLANARGLGLRPFDANLVLAVVQDAARQGQTPQDAETISRLVLVGQPQSPQTRHAGLWPMALLACSALWAAALVWWLTT